MNLKNYEIPEFVFIFVITSIMTKAIPFDTLAYIKKLISAGFTSQQAEVQAEALAE